MSVADILKKHGKWIETRKLVEMVAKEQNIGDRQAYRKIKKAWKDRQIKKVTLPDRSVLYGLPEFGPLSINIGKVIATIERLWGILLRPPTVEEIAIETGITLEGAEKLAYRSAAQTGWFPPRPKFIHESTKKLGEVLVCAARIRDGKVGEDGKSENFNYEGDMEIVEEAKRFLKEHREMLPKLSENGDKVSWPPEAQKYLGENYEPKDRETPPRFHNSHAMKCQTTE